MTLSPKINKRLLNNQEKAVDMDKETVKDVRNFLGLTQVGLAELLGVTPVAVSRWENGRSKPTNATIKQLKKLKEERPL